MIKSVLLGYLGTNENHRLHSVTDYLHSRSPAAALCQNIGYILGASYLFSRNAHHHISGTYPRIGSGRHKLSAAFKAVYIHYHNAVGQHFYAEGRSAGHNSCLVHLADVNIFYRYNAEKPKRCASDIAAAVRRKSRSRFVRISRGIIHRRKNAHISLKFQRSALCDVIFIGQPHIIINNERRSRNYRNIHHRREKPDRFFHAAASFPADIFLKCGTFFVCRTL